MIHCPQWVNLQFHSRDVQREELEQEIGKLEKEARAREEEIEELVGSSPF